jgi:hypothetical protein
MVEVQEATYVIDPAGGGELRADMTLGTQKLSTTLPVSGEDSFLQSILDDLKVRLETVSYLSVEGRREIHATLGIGARQFVARIPLEEDEATLTPSIDLLLQTVGARFVKVLESSLPRADAEHGEGVTGAFPADST